jgi:adenosylhomocysteine nucleosidase
LAFVFNTRQVYNLGMSNFNDGSILICFAMKAEAQNFFQDEHVLYTGLGKVNATYTLMQRLRVLERDGRKRPSCVLNFGTAGSRVFKSQSVVECVSFIQRDIDFSAVGFLKGETPFESMPAVIEVPRRFPQLPKAICGTGDSVVTDMTSLPCDVVDMEAYALAKVCRLEGIPFSAIKFITDGADSEFHSDWKSNLPLAAKAFWKVYKDQA